MIDYGKTRSTIKPEPVKIDQYSVWVHANIKPVTEIIDDHEFNGFEFDMVQYDKNEYIQIIAEQNAALEQQVTDVQLALVEIYEGVL